MEKIKVEKSVFGSYINTPGYGMNLFSKLDKKSQAIFDLGLRNCYEYLAKNPVFWYIPGNTKTMLILGQNQFTCFPESNRSYPQDIRLLFDNSNINKINIGDVFSSCSLFKQYTENEYPQGTRLGDDIEVHESKFQISANFSNFMKEIAKTEKKVIIQCPEDMGIGDNEFASYELFQKIFYGIGSLTKELQRRIGVSTFTLYENYEREVDNPEYQMYLDKSLFNRMSSKKPKEKIRTNINNYIGGPETKIFFCYGSVPCADGWIIMTPEEIMSI